MRAAGKILASSFRIAANTSATSTSACQRACSPRRVCWRSLIVRARERDLW